MNKEMHYSAEARNVAVICKDIMQLGIIEINKLNNKFHIIYFTCKFSFANVILQYNKLILMRQYTQNVHKDNQKINVFLRQSEKLVLHLIF